MKRFRLTAVPVLVLSSALALASLMVVYSTAGRGAVRNSAGRTASFHVEASRTHHRGAVHVRGAFVLEFPSATTNTPGERLRIEAHDYFQDGNTSGFAGPAVFRRVTSSGVQELHGRGRVRFVSRRHLDEIGDPDSLEAVFSVPEGNFQFAFGGHVVSGDVTISKTESH